MWIIVVVLVIAALFGIVAGISQNQKTEERGQAMKQALADLPDFSPTMKITGINNLFTFATDNEHQKILYMVGNTPQLYNYEDIISVELLEDNQILSQKSTGRTIGGAVLGGVVAGGVGAIVGGLSGASKQQNLHSSVKVRILLRNSSVPSIELTCFDARTMNLNGKPATEDNMFYRQGITQARRITDTLTVIIDAVDRATQIQKQNSSSVVGSIADEIAKLAVLKEKGILTEEEFMAQKGKLLSNENSSEKPIPLQLELPTCDPFDEELKRIVSSEGILSAIKKYKEATGADLATSKAYVESLL